jgi:DNA polymerase-3 subunit alpha
VDRWPETQVLAYEKESLGFYLSSHPLARHEPTLRAFSSHGICALAKLPKSADGTRVLLGGMIVQLKTSFPKSGRNVSRKFARFRLEEFEGSVGCVMFADAYEQDAGAVAEEAIGFLEGTLDLTREEPDVKVDRFLPVERAYEELAAMLVIAPPVGDEERVVPLVKRLLRDFAGKTSVVLEISPVPGVCARYRVEAGGVRPCRELHDLVAAELGPDAVRWKAKKLAPPRQAARAWSNGE